MLTCFYSWLQVTSGKADIRGQWIDANINNAGMGIRLIPADTLFLVSDIIMWSLELYKIIFLEIKKYTLNLLYEKCQSVFVLTVYFI